MLARPVTPGGCGRAQRLAGARELPVVAAGSLYAGVRVDERGLTVRGPLGLPAYALLTTLTQPAHR